MEAAATQERTEIETLEAVKQEIVHELANLRTDLRNMAEPSADETDIDAYEREKTWALVQRLERKLDAVEHAMKQVEKGIYGICESCGDRIAPARLEVLPETTLCLDCQRQVERQNRRRRY